MKKIMLSIAIVLIWIGVANATITLPWSTTFHCAEWVCCSTVNCDGFYKHGDWHSSGGHYEQITTAANYSGGGGGRGQRHWVGDGQSDNSGGLRVDFDKGYPEIWFRFYVRFQSGLTWAAPLGFLKIAYVNVATSYYDECDWPRGWDDSGICLNGRDHLGGVGTGWDTIMANGAIVNGHHTSDGQWHCFEYHLKVDTNGSNGIWQLWIDGVLKVNETNMDYGGSNFTRILFGSNHTAMANGGDRYIDYDDIAISNTGYIGSVSPPSPPPSPPTNLTIIP